MTPDDDVSNIRENHHIKSYEFVKDYWEEFGIIDETAADDIALICQYHRKSYNLDRVFHYKFEMREEQKLNLKLVCALLRLADALDITSARIDETKTKYFFDLPEVSRKHWEICRLVKGIFFDDNSEIHIYCRIDNNNENSIKLIRQKLIDLFEEYFLVMIILNENGFSYYNMVAKITCLRHKESQFKDLNAYGIYQEVAFQI